MSEPKSSALEIRVRVARPGVGVRDYHLPDGATLADLLRESGAAASDRIVLVDGVTPEGALSLHDGAVVTIGPGPGDAVGHEPWRATIPSFRDEALFREYSEALKARRQADDPEEGPAA